MTCVDAPSRRHPLQNGVVKLVVVRANEKERRGDGILMGIIEEKARSIFQELKETKVEAGEAYVGKVSFAFISAGFSFVLCEWLTFFRLERVFYSLDRHSVRVGMQAYSDVGAPFAPIVTGFQVLSEDLFFTLQFILSYSDSRAF